MVIKVNMMFTGLIEETGKIIQIKKINSGIELRVAAKLVLDKINVGDSIAIDGACQTVTNFDQSSFTVFASSVTCDVTTLSKINLGDLVNLERAVTPASRLGGHIVQGHVDGIGKIVNLRKDSQGSLMEINVPGPLMKYIAAKGSIAVNGISLTVVEKNKYKRNNSVD